MNARQNLKITRVIVLFLFGMGLQAEAGSIIGWGSQVVGVDLSSGFVRLAAGWEYSLGLKEDGSVVAWGNNQYGQCNIPSPNTGFVAIAAGGVHNLALTGGKPQLRVVNKRRIERTVFQYECTAGFENLWGFAIRNLQLEMVQGSGNMTIIDPLVEFGDTELETRGRAMSTDTCTFQVDRSGPIDPDEIVWKVRCEKVITGQQMELTVAGVDPSRLASIYSDLLIQQQSDFGDLSAFARRSLWTGPAGQINEDVVPDGTVNLSDFAEFAQHWKTNP